MDVSEAFNGQEALDLYRTMQIESSVLSDERIRLPSSSRRTNADADADGEENKNGNDSEYDYDDEYEPPHSHSHCHNNSNSSSNRNSHTQSRVQNRGHRKNAPAASNRGAGDVSASAAPVFNLIFMDHTMPVMVSEHPAHCLLLSMNTQSFYLSLYIKRDSLCIYHIKIANTHLICFISFLFFLLHLYLCIPLTQTPITLSTCRTYILSNL
jgi:CheY-like chemotaxis protein